MSSVFSRLCLAAILCVSAGHGAVPLPHALAGAPGRAPAPSAAAHEFRVCADPNNLPFSNRRGEGFENAIADLLARDLGRTLTYFWMPERRGFLRNTLRAGVCDVVMGLPPGYPQVRTTRPYYTSTYVFVTRRDRRLGLSSIDDRRLARLRIGVQLTGDDYDNPPAAQALATRHLEDNIRGFMVYGDYSGSDPQREIVDAVASGGVDTAIVWGPLAGYYASREPVPLDLAPVRGGDPRRFVFGIAIGVRQDAVALQQVIERALARRRPQIAGVLRRFGVPQLDAERAILAPPE